MLNAPFESFANSKRYKTQSGTDTDFRKFESFANSKRYKTDVNALLKPFCLRALLIQKDTKRTFLACNLLVV